MTEQTDWRGKKTEEEGLSVWYVKRQTGGEKSNHQKWLASRKI